jgi:hypothetical protein
MYPLTNSNLTLWCYQGIPSRSENHCMRQRQRNENPAR